MEGESASALTALPAGQPPQAAKCSRGEGNQRATYPFYPFGLAHTHTHTYSRSWRATHTHARTCVYTPHMRAPSWKTGSKHTAISSTSGCSARGNELSNSQSSGRTVGSSTGGGNWLVNTFSLFFMGPEWRRGMSLFYLEHPRVGSGGLKLLGVKRFGMIEVNQFIC